MSYEQDLVKILLALYETGQNHVFYQDIKVKDEYDKRIFDALLAKLEDRGYIKIMNSANCGIVAVMLTDAGILEANSMQ